MFIYILIGFFIITEGIRAALPYKLRNNKTKVYCFFVYISSVLTPLLLLVILLNHIFRWDATILAGKFICFFILLAVLCICEVINIHEIRAIKNKKEERNQNEN